MSAIRTMTASVALLLSHRVCIVHLRMRGMHPPASLSWNTGFPVAV